METNEKQSPEIAFKKDILNLFNAQPTVFHKVSSNTKNVYKYWYHRGYIDPNGIYKMFEDTKKYQFVKKSPVLFGLKMGKLKCIVEIFEKYHTVSLNFEINSGK